MGNAVITREGFRKIKSTDVKLDILFDTTLKTQEMLKGKKLDFKSFAGGILGGFIAVIAKMAIWR